ASTGGLVEHGRLELRVGNAAAAPTRGRAAVAIPDRARYAEPPTLRSHLSEDTVFRRNIQEVDTVTQRETEPRSTRGRSHGTQGTERDNGLPYRSSDPGLSPPLPGWRGSAALGARSLRGRSGAVSGGCPTGVGLSSVGGSS